MAGCVGVILLTALISLATGQTQSVLESLINEVLGPAPQTSASTQNSVVPQQGPTVNNGALGSNSGPQISDVRSLGVSSFGSPQAGSGQMLQQQGSVRPFCSDTERQTLYRSCAMSFGMAHMRHFNFLASQRTCRSEVFSCSRVDELIKCTNSQPVSVISNRCWSMIRNVLTGFLRQNNIPCTYEDLYKKCNTTSADVLPIEQRVQSGQGMNTNPMETIGPIIMRHVMPMVMMMTSGGGGLASMFGF